MENKIIYLDHAAATPLDDRVIAAMSSFLKDEFYNPSSSYLPAVKVRHAYEDARHSLAVSIGGKPGEIIITAGATESINLAFNGIEGHVVVPNIEHQAVLACARSHNHTIVDSDDRGYVSPDTIKSAIKSDTQLVSVALANNELGTVQPIKEISRVIREERSIRLANNNKTPIFLHCDASQGVGQLDVNVARLGVDMLTINSGKIYGPKQVGLLWAASYVNLKPLILGGGQERGIRSGTENVAGVIGFARALELAVEHRRYESERLAELRDCMQRRLIETFPNMVVSGYQKHRLSGHLHVSFPGLDGERLVFMLESNGVLVSTGSACAANKGTRSHVLTSIGLKPDVADGSIRITLGHLSNKNDIEIAIDLIIAAAKSEYARIAQC